MKGSTCQATLEELTMNNTEGRPSETLLLACVTTNFESMAFCRPT